MTGKRLFVAGHRGMVGSAIVRRLAREDCQVLTVDRSVVDLKNQTRTQEWFLEHVPDAVILAAARVGGIAANNAYPADFLYDNLMIEANVIEAAFRAKISKLLFLGSSCIYPKHTPQPIPEEALLTGPLETTNEWYAIAKIAGIKLCQAYRRQHGCDFISAMPANLYGPGDNFSLDTGHVIPALIRKAHDAKRTNKKSLEIWGTGKPRREFLHVDDCANAVVHLVKSYSGDSHVNIGFGSDVTISELAALVAGVVGFQGEIVQDATKPDGTPRKLMCSDRIRGMGWMPQIELHPGIASTYKWFIEHRANQREWDRLS